MTRSGLICCMLLVMQLLFFALAGFSQHDCYPIIASDLQDPKAPRFDQFRVPVQPITPAAVDLKSHPRARTYGTVLRREAAEGPNFAGSHTVVGWGCGTSCLTFAIVNARTGRVIFPKGISEVSADHFNSDDFLPGNGPYGSLRYRLDSKLLVLVGSINEDVTREGAFYFVLDDNELKPVFSVRVKRRNCEREGSQREEPALKLLEPVSGPDTQEEACNALVSRVAEAKLFPKIPRECFMCDLEGSDTHSFRFALRFNKGKCSEDTVSTLLDRFLVFKRSPAILLYDSAEDRYLPWEYAWTYRNRNKE